MIQISENAQGVWRARIVGVNGQEVFATEPFASLANAVAAVWQVHELSPYRVSVKHSDGRVETSRNIASLKRRGESGGMSGFLRGVLEAIPRISAGHRVDP